MEPKIDTSRLAMKMLRWEEAQLFADGLRAEIETTVMAIGKTQTVGNVRASYSAGRKSYDYRKAADGNWLISEAAVEQFTVTPPPKTDWRKVCNHVGIKDIPFTQSDPSVRVKLLSE